MTHDEFWLAFAAFFYVFSLFSAYHDFSRGFNKSGYCQVFFAAVQLVFMILWAIKCLA